MQIPNLDDIAIGEALFHTLRLPEDANFIIAYSGGMDSQVLLHVLVALRNRLAAQDATAGRTLKLFAAHLDHGLAEPSAQWAEQCRKHAENQGVPFFSRRICIDPASGEGVEGAARRVRYQWLATQAVAFVKNHSSTAGKYIILTAHHMNDQAETFLMRLFQGRGTAALAGIAPQRPVFSGSAILLARPLLRVMKSQIEDYAIRHNLQWIEDPGNRDPRFYRNWLRTELMPCLSSRMHDLVPKLAQAAEHCRHITDRIDRTFARRLPELIRPEKRSVFCLCDPIAMPPIAEQQAWFSDVRCWLKSNMSHMPRHRALESFYDQLLSNPCRYASLCSGSCVLHAYNRILYLTRRPPEPLAKPVSWMDAECQFHAAGLELTIDDGIATGLCPELDVNALVWGWRQGAECFHVAGREKTKKLKDLHSEYKIPPWQRRSIPVLYLGSRIIWAHGLGVAQGYVSEQRSGWLPRFQLRRPQ